MKVDWEFNFTDAYEVSVFHMYQGKYKGVEGLQQSLKNLVMDLKTRMTRIRGGLPNAHVYMVGDIMRYDDVDFLVKLHCSIDMAKL
jgi:hypothetical protein